MDNTDIVLEQKTAENMFQAFQLISSAQIKELAFDKTLICSIESIVNKSKGIYQVTDGPSHFKAYSQGAEYNIGETVYVIVPNGDMSQQKIISGKYVEPEDDKKEYIASFDSIIEIVNIPNISGSIPINTGVSFVSVIEPTGLEGPYEIIGIKGDFKTNLPIDTFGGAYGLQLTFIDEYNQEHTLVFDSTDMYGNPYRYTTAYTQEFAFEVPAGVKSFNNIELKLFQDNNFTTGINNEYIVNSDNKNYGIILENCQVVFGFNTQNFNEETVFLQPTGALEYTRNDESIGTSLFWIKDKDGTLVSIDKIEELPANTKIHWYRYTTESDQNDELAGNLWKEVENLNTPFVHTFYPNTENSLEGIKVIIESPTKESILQELTSSEMIGLREELDGVIIDGALKEEVQNNISYMINSGVIAEITNFYNSLKEKLTDNNEAIGYLDQIYNLIIFNKQKIKYYKSDDLFFTNKTSDADKLKDLIQGLKLEVDLANQKGIYFLYNNSKKLINSAESEHYRIIKVSYNSVLTGDENLDKFEEITWYIPIKNTMIKKPEDGKEYNSEYDEYSEDTEKGLAIIRRKIQNTDYAGAGLIANADEQIFRIKETYSEFNTNNIIKCEVKKVGFDTIYMAETELFFGITGNNGSELGLSIELYDKNNKRVYSIPHSGEPIQIKTRFYNYNNETVNLGTPTFSWLHNKESDENFINLYENEEGNFFINCNKNKSLTELGGYILKVSSGEQYKGKTISGFLPIAVHHGTQSYILNGSAEIIYNSMGTNPEYYKDRLFIQDINGNEITGGTWSGIIEGEQEEEGWYPTIEKEGLLKPSASTMYISNLKPFNIYYSDLWIQPILIIQNAYGNSILNEWDGSLTLGEKNGIILSSMMGAGKKDEENRFTGVLMGDIQGDITLPSLVGLYGYQKGEQSFGFHADGTAFIGKSGTGRINFDGNEGTIISGNYNENNETGTYLGLKEGVFKAYQGEGNYFLVNKGKVSIASTDIALKSGNSSLTLKDNKGINLSVVGEENGISVNLSEDRFNLIKSVNVSEDGINFIKKEQTLLNFGGDSDYLQSFNYEAENSGTYFNLTNGIFESYRNVNNYLIVGENNVSIASENIKLSGNNSSLTIDNKGISLEVINNNNNGIKVELTENNLLISNVNDNESPDDSSYTGFDFDLAEGVLDWRVNGIGILANLMPNEDTYLLSLGSKNNGFTLDYNGNATFSGTLTAQEGIVAGWNITEYGLFDFIPDYETLQNSGTINYFTANEEINIDTLTNKYVYYSPIAEGTNDQIKAGLKLGILIKGICLIRQGFIQNRSKLRYATGTFIVMKERDENNRPKVYFLSNVKKRPQLRKSLGPNEQITDIAEQSQYAWPDGLNYRRFKYVIINSDGELKAKEVTQDPDAEN